MKKLLLPFAVLLAVTLTACDDKDGKFEGTSWNTTSYEAGYDTWISFSDGSCNIRNTLIFGQHYSYSTLYTYTHSGNTAYLTPIGEAQRSHQAVISGSILTLTNLNDGSFATLRKK